MGLDLVCPIIIVIQSILYIMTIVLYRREVSGLENQRKELLDVVFRLNNLEKANVQVLDMILSCLKDEDIDMDDIENIENSIDCKGQREENGLKNIIEQGSIG